MVKNTIKAAAVAILALLPVAAHADAESEAILARIAAALKGYASYEVRFSASAGDMDDIEGYYVVSGDRWRINVAGSTHFSDGVSRYEIYDDNREIVVDSADNGQHTIFANPARAFEFASGEFSSVYLGRETLLGKEHDMILLTPLSRTYGNMSIVLWVSVETGLPTSISYRQGDETVDVVISRIKPLDTVDNALFGFNPDDYAGYEVIDFR